MVVVLALRHLFVRPGRAALLLFGYSVGAAVMMVLLSVGEAMLVQSRDVALVGGGDVTVLPEGIDLEGLRTGSMTGLFFGIDRARFLERQLIGGPRLRDVVAATSPTIEHELLYLEHEGRLHPVRAGAEVPSAAERVGSPLAVTSGRWVDSDRDRRFMKPTAEELYHELDRFHAPMADSTWGEWHYFNFALSEDEWWYVTFLIGGSLAGGGGGGQLLITRHRGAQPVARFESNHPPGRIRFDTTSADLVIGPHSVTQRDGRYRLVGSASGPSGTVRIDVEVEPQPNAYFPPIELGGDSFRSGYVVAAVRATGTGTICENGRCARFERVPAYHDHNWGTWRETTWNWGQGRGAELSILYGGVITPDSALAPSRSPYFLAVVDNSGVRQILRFSEIEHRGRRTTLDGVPVPAGLRLVAGRDRDTVRLEVDVLAAQATRTGMVGDRIFLQMRGRFRVTGKLLGAVVADSGLGFFETFVGDRRSR